MCNNYLIDIKIIHFTQVLRNGPHTIKGKQIEAKRAKVRPGIKKIFVGGIESDMTEADIRNYFEHYGKVMLLKKNS